jgi:hypothetical protein
VWFAAAEREVIGVKLPMKPITPEEAQGVYGWLAMFVGPISRQRA